MLTFFCRYVAHSCNFFLFPTTFGILDSEFSFQASSVQFLNQYGFDYNKVRPGGRGGHATREGDGARKGLRSRFLPVHIHVKPDEGGFSSLGSPRREWLPRPASCSSSSSCL